MKNKNVIDYGVSFRLERKQYDKIVEICRERNMSVSQYYRLISQLSIDLYEKMNKKYNEDE